MDDKSLAEFLLEYGFANEEQIEAAYKKQKEMPEKLTLGQIVVRDGTVTVRALKTIHASHARKLERQEREALRGPSFTRFGKAFDKKEDSKPKKPVTKPPEKKKEEEKKPVTDKPEQERDKAKSRSVKDAKPPEIDHVMLKSLRDDMALLEKQVSFLREDVKLLRRWAEHEMIVDIRSHVREQIEELRKTDDSENAK